MKALNKTVFLPIMLLLFALTVVSQIVNKIPDEIAVSLKSGNAKILATFFNQNIELRILDNDNVYSKAQAEQIVNNFFNRYVPERFNIIHQGGKEGAHYVIGNLVTRQETFRVYFLLKQTNDKNIIHQLIIEKQE
jgi:hypothetical protein